MITDITMILIALIWVGGTWFRAYQQARFYQIEEYKSSRYLRWWLAKRERFLPNRPLMAAVVGGILAFFLSEGAVPILPAIIWIIASIIGVLPEKQVEVKKGFKATGRAQRILGAAFVISGAVAALIISQFGRLPDMPEIRFAVAGIVGLVLYLAAPLWLSAGNIAMTPVESLLRQRFIQQAKTVMAQVNPKVIGITGSYGKTTTKNFIADILNGRYNAYATPKSFNTMMGICIAINNDVANNYAIDYFIVEMGAYFQGEIRRICDLTPPSIGVMVEVGPQHLERFGTLENTATAKYELIKALPPDGAAVFNWDNEYVRAMYERGYPAVRIAVSRIVSPQHRLANGPRFVASQIHESLEGLTFTVTDTQTGESEVFTTLVLGEHNVTNILLATAVAIQEGMTLRDVAFRVRTLRPAESRLVRQMTANGITIINDAYSANPAGIVSSLKVLGLHQTGKRLLVTPGMIELAQLHEQENKRLGQLAAQYATDVILVGEEQTRPIYAGLQEAKFPQDRLHVVPTLSEAIKWYQTNLGAGDTVLFLNDLPDTY